ncbi:GNAT family N-acetyltransferase [Sphingobium sp. DEHP117]|uniref:GNAT family N-acetyltransferase n=1 Tax=Sphingobium sp. DEHP117 TaxID=2993436 RepID=UPI0027D68498|nr:GNAT family N-acetyltransferase [Sphingobium sp. DEHP117]MDQ4419215.1 GNAT family N-acetyltransferase [Sphingobium sp. DEHP117]
MHLSARFENITDLQMLGSRWRALENAAHPASFFLRWTWMGSWLAALQQAGIPLPQLLVIGDEMRDEGMALVGAGEKRRMFGSVPALWLNEAGDTEGDRPFIEYNGILCAKDKLPFAVHAFCEAMAEREDWRMLYLSGLGFGSLLTEVPGVRRRVIRDASPAYHADLKAVREAGGDYLSLLSANTRGQIKRSLKDEPGELTIDIASDERTLDHWLDDMRTLNTGRHADNAWDSAFFRDFVSRLTRAGLADGTVELMRIASDGTTIGYLLNFVWAGRAMNYQSAFAEPGTAKSKPGLMCHATAVAHYAARDFKLYSFLAGKDRYKHSLSTGAEELNWWALERFDWRLEAEAVLRRLFRR